MQIAVTYSIIPSFGEASSLHFQYDKSIDKKAKYWTLFGGVGADTQSEKPWWANDQGNGSNPDYLNEQTTNIIINLLSNLNICAVPEFATGCEGTTYELEIYAGNNQVKYTWWEDLPLGWDSLSSFTSFLDGFLNAKREKA